MGRNSIHLWGISAMSFYQLSPEVAGGFGSNTQLNRTVHPPIVTRLHYEFEGWLGDDLLESFPCYIVTRQLADSLSTNALSGVTYKNVEITQSDVFMDLYPNRQLPEFVWIDITGIPGQNDFGLDDHSRLIVSESVMAILRSYKISHCAISNYANTLRS